MPDLTFHSFYSCQTNREWHKQIPSSSGGAPYTLTWGRLYGRAAQKAMCEFGYACTCKGFQVRGVCKHITAAEAADRQPVRDRCGWDQNWSHEQHVEGAGCPRCGGPVFAYIAGV